MIYFPFQTLGFAALVILAALAFTSHDFWLHFLSPKFWKVLHMLVYVAYALILMHVALGVLQLEKSPVLVGLLITGFLVVTSLHLWAGYRENRNRKMGNDPDNNWIFACNVEDIAEDRATMINLKNDRVAIFKYNGKLSAVHNVCKHQMGPLGEGKIIDGCITCPWHGYQYRPEDGCAPPPFTEKVATYQLELRANKIFVNTSPLPEGTFVEPVAIEQTVVHQHPAEFFIGWANNSRKVFTVPKITAVAAVILLLVIGVVLSANQKKISGFAIDYNNVKKMEGWLSVKPVPNLKIIDSKDPFGNPVFKTILLMDAFKFGADQVVKTVLNGDSVKYVRLTGYVSSNIIGCSDSSKDCVEICSQCITGTTNNPVMEIENGQYSFETIKSPLNDKMHVSMVGPKTLIGEIIDPKCYFGAMNPGLGKPHLSCAARCISGGIMPVLKYEVNNHNKYAVLIGLKGEKINNDVLKYIGLPVEIKGDLSLMDNWEILSIDPQRGIHPLN